MISFPVNFKWNEIINMERNSSHAVNSHPLCAPFCWSRNRFSGVLQKAFSKMTSWSCVCVHVAVVFSSFLSLSLSFDIPRFQHRQNDKALPWILIFAWRIVKSLVVRLFKLSLRKRTRIVFSFSYYNFITFRRKKKRERIKILF